MDTQIISNFYNQKQHCSEYLQTCPLWDLCETIFGLYIQQQNWMFYSSFLFYLVLIFIFDYG